METFRTGVTVPRRGAGLAIRAGVVAGYALLVCGCQTDQQVAGVPAVPTDVRMRHPITLTEGRSAIRIFMGSNRSMLTASQRAEVLAFAQNWRHDATGGVVIDVPAGSSNARSSAEAIREITSILSASGVQPQAVQVRNYSAGPDTLAAIRITYPRITAQAGPCGLWPQDIGPSMNRDYFENQPFWNLGCSSQRNLAAMVANPSDLVQPRAESPIYAERQTVVLEKYRAGASTATTYTASDASKISDVGK